MGLDPRPILGSTFLARMAYVDLNLIRAGIAETPETSEFTSAYSQIQAINMLEDLANTSPPVADARRRDEPSGAESNDAAHSLPTSRRSWNDSASGPTTGCG